MGLALKSTDAAVVARGAALAHWWRNGQSPWAKFVELFLLVNARTST
jgi:hypothetical protein